MPESQDLATNVLEQALELTRDHQQLLCDVATRLEPYGKQLLESWSKAYRSAVVRHPLPPDPIIRSVQQEALRVLYEGLKRSNLRQYFAEVATWGYRTARTGLSYDHVILLVHEYRRSCFPFLRRLYPLTQELELVLAAQDDLYLATTLMIGSVYIQSAQEQLLNSTRLRVLGHLTIGATHAMNNLQTAILGRTQLLIERTRDPEVRTELQEIYRTASASAQMIHRLQDFARIGRDEKFADTDINALIREAAEITRFVWRDQAEVSGIVIDVVKDLADVPPVFARPNELRELLMSLILNSVEAMPRGGLVTLRTERKGDNVLISVIDTGEGMPEETRLRVFEPFFTTKSPPHSGLGLNAAATIVLQHKGTMAVESSPGRGTMFTIALPVAPGSSTEPKAEETIPGASTARVLIIDDEATVRDIVAKFLTYRGYQVTVADSGREGISAFKQSGYDLVVTDLGMPGMSGWEVAAEIKRLNPKTLVVLMSGWAADLDKQKLKGAGVDRLVHKPFDVDEILALVNEAVAMRDKM